MAENKRKAGGSGPARSAATASCSTRFDAKQRELIVEAAKIVDCSPAKLIRDSAVARAVDVVNGAEGAKDLRILARELVSHLLNPRLQIFKAYEHSQGLTPSVVGYSEEMVSLMAMGEDDPFRAEGVQVLRPAGGVLEQIKSALETSGTEFVRLMLEEWEEGKREYPEYKPRLKASEVLGGETD